MYSQRNYPVRFAQRRPRLTLMVYITIKYRQNAREKIYQGNTKKIIICHYPFAGLCLYNDDYNKTQYVKRN